MDSVNLTILRRVGIGAILLVVFALASGFGGCPASYSNPGGGGGLNPGAVVATPNPLSLPCATNETFSVSQIYYSGSFTPSGVDGTKITVTATSPPNTFVVHALDNSTYTTTFIVTGGGGMTTTETINNIGCTCVRHHDMWGSASKRAH
jgi:hypothetical protein